MRIIQLSKQFYERYENCPEILRKPSRPYFCLELHVENTVYAIPLRHHIMHQYSFMTVGTSGLDYTKAVIINDETMISSKHVRIDTAEWRMLISKEDVILSGFTKYLRLFRKALKKKGIPKYERIVKYSALQYFIGGEMAQ